MTDDIMPIRTHGAAGQLVTNEPLKTRELWAVCGSCGEAWRGVADLRCRSFRLECPHCGALAGLEIKT